MTRGLSHSRRVFIAPKTPGMYIIRLVRDDEVVLATSSVTVSYVPMKSASPDSVTAFGNGIAEKTGNTGEVALRRWHPALI